MKLINRLLLCIIVILSHEFLAVESANFGRKTSRVVCHLRDGIENGYYVDSNEEMIERPRIKPGKIIEARCNPGFGLSGPKYRRCKYSTKDFSEVAPVCKDIDECRYIRYQTFDQDDSWEASQEYSSISEYEDELQVDVSSLPRINCHDMAYCVNTLGSFKCVCDSGYEGDGVNSCQKVVPKTCNPLDPPLHGYMEGEPTRLVRFHCEQGYRIVGARSRECVDGVWKGLHPVCEEDGCGEPGTPTNGYIFGTKFAVGNWVIFGCNDGYELAGQRKRECLSGDGYRFDDYWSGFQPICRPVANDVNIVANNIKTDFIDHLEVFTHSGRGRLAVSDNIGLDLVFAYDISTSLNHVNFERGINFTESLLRQFGVSYDKGGTRIAVISFAEIAEIEFTYGPDVETFDEVFERINLLKDKRGGGTDLDQALEKVFALTSDMRNGSKRALFIMTDGVVTVGEDPAAIAESLRVDEGIEIFVVAVGEGIDRRQLRKIASQPYSTHVFLLENFEDLAALTEIISEKGQEYRRCGQAGNLELPRRGVQQARESNANPGAWPWLVQIIKLTEDGALLQCGGALLCENWILTAGSCVFDLETFAVDPGNLRVRLGAYELGVQEEIEQEFNVSEVILHEDFDPFNRFHDIALLRLNQTVNLTSSVRTLCFPSDVEIVALKSNTMCYIAGWGIVDPVEDQPKNDSMPSVYPKQLEIPLVNDDVCAKTMSHPYPFTKQKMCAGYRYNNDGACQGDTGAPLVCRQIDGSWAVTGVSSYSKKCMMTTKYSVFTRISEYTNWIHTMTRNCTSNYLADLTVGGFT